MAQCKLCERSGWFLSLSNNALCQRCEPLFQIDLHQRVRIVQDSQKIVHTSRSLDTKISRIQLAIDHLLALEEYERRGIETIQPPPSEAIANYTRRRHEEVANHAKLFCDEAMANADTAATIRAKITALTKGLLKIRQLARHTPVNTAMLEHRILDRIASETMTEYLEKARKAEFKGDKKKALEQYYEALYFLKHDEVDDRLQDQHIKQLEEKILGLGGSLNYEMSSGKGIISQ